MTSFLRAKAFLLISAVLGVHLASCSTPNVLEQDTTNTIIIIIENMQGSAAGRLQQPTTCFLISAPTIASPKGAARSHPISGSSKSRPL